MFRFIYCLQEKKEDHTISECAITKPITTDVGKAKYFLKNQSLIWKLWLCSQYKLCLRKVKTHVVPSELTVGIEQKSNYKVAIGTESEKDLGYGGNEWQTFLKTFNQ